MTRLVLARALGFLFVAAGNDALAQTKAQRCAAYAQQAMRSTPSTTGPARGAARGAIGGAIVGNAGAGAAAGAVVGTARRAAQKNRSYQSYYNSCMMY